MAVLKMIDIELVYSSAYRDRGGRGDKGVGVRVMVFVHRKEMVKRMKERRMIRVRKN